ncbi:MAG TPA: sugar ABC transporter permease [Chloroflexota bacterium]|nr:sugar ABC transporter permease [Chloroflexota bacterium]
MLGWYSRLSFSRKEELAGYLFILPWLIGFVVFQAGAMVTALAMSFLKADFLSPPTFVGTRNFERLIDDDTFFKALGNTAVYALGRMPFVIVIGLSIALLLNRDRWGVRGMRTLYFLPSVTSGVAVALLWIWMFNPDYGLINSFLALFGIRGPGWIWTEEWALPGLIVVSLWGVGSSMLIYLAGLRGVPVELYEAASLDGAGPARKFFRITLPMISPTLFYTLITGIIFSYQVFLNAYILTNGGPNNATLTMVLYVYRKAFQEFQMGYASAVAWVLFMIILLFTLLVFRSSSAWVYYEGGLRRTGPGT